MERLNFSFYDPVPTVAPPNDDLELQLVWLCLVERLKPSLSTADFGEAWVRHLHYMWDEYGRCRWNLRRGVPLEHVGTFENHFQSGMGSPIRSEIWACLFPGDLDSAASYAAMDASLDHGLEGIAGETLFAVMQSAVLGGESIQGAIKTAVSYLPTSCEVATAVGEVQAALEQGIEPWKVWELLCCNHGNDNFTHAPLNVALTIWALLAGEGDFERSILLAVNGGYDTDCTAATVGATLGLALGADCIPRRWIEPIGESVFVGPGIVGIDAPRTISELTERVTKLIGKVAPKEWNPSIWKGPSSDLDLASLPGTIDITTRSGDQKVGWANGELPSEIKEAGGGTWTWEVAKSRQYQVILVAPAGGRLFIDEDLVVDCPTGVPYVPATHRSPPGTTASYFAPAGFHRVRIELHTANRLQDATVLLAYPNLHLAPWTRAELPDEALLPSPA
jgi:hypothetical protein